jgi:hypothetical protein
VIKIKKSIRDNPGFINSNISLTIFNLFLDIF